MKKRIIVISVMILTLIFAIPAEAVTRLDHHRARKYYNWNGGTSNWLILEQAATVYGEESATASYPDSTVINRFNTVYTVKRDLSRMLYGYTYVPVSRYHKVLIEKYSTPGAIWTPDINWAFENSANSPLGDLLQPAIDYLFDIASWYLALPIPSPMQFINKKGTPATTITGVSGTSAQVAFNYDQTVMSVEYSIQVAKPVKAGTYQIRIRYYAQPGMMINNPYLALSDEQSMSENVESENTTSSVYYEWFTSQYAVNYANFVVTVVNP